MERMEWERFKERNDVKIEEMIGRVDLIIK